MATTYQVLRVFVASPGDVERERRYVTQVLQSVNHVCCEPLGVLMEDTSWPTLPPVIPAEGQTVQEVLQNRVAECDVFILILNQSYGTPVSPRSSISRTEQEVNIALERLRNGTGPIFLAYFRELPPTKDRDAKVVRLMNRLKKKGLIGAYANPQAFAEILTHHFYDAVLRYRFSTSKYKALKTFWQFGTAERPTHPRLAITYPPIDVSYMNTGDPDMYWMSRLMPNVVFEDFKALQKIDKSLRQIGFNEFTIYSTTGPPPDLLYMNRVWLCLPRSLKARNQLASHGERSRARFNERLPDTEAKIRWTVGRGEEVKIHSPLSKYLRRQRQGMTGREWDTAKGRIIAKDFAVLARIIDYERQVPVRDTPLVDYFLAGIRGLGTWGAAWFIDRKYGAFLPYRADQDIQLLLEITYRDERIFDVRDVSDEPAEYFKTENSDAEVDRVIQDYQQAH